MENILYTNLFRIGMDLKKVWKQGRGVNKLQEDGRKKDDKTIIDLLHI